ncbi:MAG: hypothetical protein U1E14_13905 [Geminicoccaceae bacterium]
MTTVPVDPPSDEVLGKALLEARQLLWFATREGKPLAADAAQSAAIVDAVVATESALREGKRDAATEARFWSGLRDLARAVQPISIESIAATHGGLSDRGSMAQITKRRYARATLLTLVALLLTQIYWFVGNTIRTDLEDNRRELDELAGAFRTFAAESAILQQQIEAKQAEIVQRSQAVDPVRTSSQEVGALMQESLRLAQQMDDPSPQQQVLALTARRTQEQLDFVNRVRRSERVLLMRDGNSAFLETWDFVADLVGAGAPRRDDSAATAVTNLLERIKGCSATPEKVTADCVRGVETFLVEEQREPEMSLVSSKSMVAVLNQYLLPLLYGLLGSLAYILRTLSTEIQQVTFTGASRTRYSLRWPLGMLAGVTVGLFFDPTKVPSFESLTPLGIAFLAGYGVEVLFTGLDRLVSAFTGDAAATPAASRLKPS